MNPVVTSASHSTERRVAILSFTFFAALVAACGAAPGDGVVESGSSAVTVGGSNGGTDYAATVTSGTIATAVGMFPSVTGVTSEVDSNANNYMLQMNSNLFTTPLCSPNGVAIPKCVGWQQYFYSPRGGATQTGRLYIEYWLLNYGPTCPTGWTVQGGNACDLNSPETVIPAPPITSLASLQLVAGAGLLDTLTMWIGNVSYDIPAQPSVLGLAKAWTTAEFNVFGNMDGSNAVFNSGSTITVRTLVISATPTTAAPRCSEWTSTAETSNLNLNTSSCTTLSGTYPGIQFSETNLLGATCGPNEVVDTAGVCVAIGSGCGTTGGIIVSSGQCVGIGGTCGTNAVVTTAATCAVVGSTCVNTSGPPDTYVYDTAGACVAVGSGCGSEGGVINPSGQCVGVGSECDGPNTVVSNLGDCVTIGSGCIVNGDAPGTWTSGGQCDLESITCPPGEAVAGPPGNQYCYVPSSSSSSGGTVGGGSSSSGGGGGGGSSGAGCPKCPKIQ